MLYTFLKKCLGPFSSILLSAILIFLVVDKRVSLKKNEFKKKYSAKMFSCKNFSLEKNFIPKRQNCLKHMLVKKLLLPIKFLLKRFFGGQHFWIENWSKTNFWLKNLLGRKFFYCLETSWFERHFCLKKIYFDLKRNVCPEKIVVE